MKKKIKLLICDIDGTLVTKGGEPLPQTKEALEIAHSQGILLGLATGRPADRRVINRFKEWGLPFDPDVVIGFNGCEIWDKEGNETRRYDLLEKENIREILDYVWDFDLNAIVYVNGYDLLVARRMDWLLSDSQRRNSSNIRLGDKELIGSYDSCKLELHYDEAIENELFARVDAHRCDRYGCIKTFYGTLEFQKPNVSKGNALRIFCEDKKIPLEEVLACGDMDNDIPMMKAAGMSVCLANGSQATKNAADRVTEYGVTEDGLGICLKKYYL